MTTPTNLQTPGRRGCDEPCTTVGTHLWNPANDTKVRRCVLPVPDVGDGDGDDGDGQGANGSQDQEAPVQAAQAVRDAS